VLVVDDEKPARTELSYLLAQDERTGQVLVAADASQALRHIEAGQVDVIFLDIRMPGLDGLELARVLRRFSSPPAVVFVTAYDVHALEAFDLRATDYLLKPVVPQRLGEALQRVLEAQGRAGNEPVTPAARGKVDPADETIAVDLGGVTRFVQRSEVLYVEAHGDYARLVTASGRYLVRIPLSVLEERWASAGFIRIHRGWLLSVSAIEEIRTDGGHMTVRVGADTLEVSRRHTRALRVQLVRSAQLRRDSS
jgi:DNA-binding LytR/AlgR family response regulator